LAISETSVSATRPPRGNPSLREDGRSVSGNRPECRPDFATRHHPGYPRALVSARRHDEASRCRFRRPSRTSEAQGEPTQVRGSAAATTTGEHGSPRGPPRRRGRESVCRVPAEDHGVAWASGLPLSAGQEAPMAGEHLEALLPRAMDVRSERTLHVRRERIAAWPSWCSGSASSAFVETWRG
jgi:hypothetical protein